MSYVNTMISVTAARLLLHKVGTSEWPTWTNNQMWLLTWNSEAVTFILVESWEFPKFFSSQSPTVVSGDGFYCRKWLNWKIPSETSCTFPDIQSFCSKESGHKMIPHDLAWVYVGQTVCPTVLITIKILCTEAKAWHKHGILPGHCESIALQN